VQDKVVNEMDELYAFMARANSTLDLRVGREGDESDGEEAAESPEGADPEARRVAQEEQARCCAQICLPDSNVVCYCISVMPCVGWESRRV
jgi:hypothetical protein